MSKHQKIFTFQPILFSKIWGGKKISKYFKRPGLGESIGESWELSDYKNYSSVVTNGENAGKTFHEIWTDNPVDVLGRPFKKIREFPLLFKIIDSKDWLSVQVHPNDIWAERLENEFSGKKEAWYILDASEKAEIICGFKKSVHEEEVFKLLTENRVDEVLNKIQCRKGDFFLINPGIVHALGPGCLIYEVQQSSDITYRVYDYNRLGQDGKLRDLHIDKALRVLNYTSGGYDAYNADGMTQVLTKNDKFCLEKWELSETKMLSSDSRDPVFHVLTVIEGSVKFSGLESIASSGTTVLIPSAGIREGVQIEALEPSKILAVTPGFDSINRGELV